MFSKLMVIRDRLEVSVDISKEKIESLAFSFRNIQKYIEGKLLEGSLLFLKVSKYCSLKCYLSLLKISLLIAIH